MLTDPSPRNVLDQRLADLVDEELARRLVVSNPELYPDSRERLDFKLLDQLRVAEPPSKAGALRRIGSRSAVVALAIVAVVEGFVLAPFVQQRLRAQTAPPAATTHKPVAPARTHVARQIHASARPQVAPATHAAKANAAGALAAQQAAQAQREAAARTAAIQSAAAAKAQAQTTHAHRLAAVTASVSHSQPAARPLQATHTQARSQTSSQSQMEVPDSVMAGSPVTQASSSSSQGSGTGPGSGSVGTGDGASPPSTPVWNERPPTGGNGGVILSGSAGAVVIDATNCSPSRAHFFGPTHSPGF